MSENRQRASRKREAKCGSVTKKSVQSKTKLFAGHGWLEDLDAYRSIIYQISRSKGVLHDYF